MHFGGIYVFLYRQTSETPNKTEKRFKTDETFLWTNCYWQLITCIKSSSTICIWNGSYTRPIKNNKERQRIKETRGQIWKAGRWKKRRANREEVEGRSAWGSSKQREQPKKRDRKKIDCMSELVVLKKSQTLRPSPQPHLHKLQHLPLPSPASGPAINTFSITSTGEQKGKGGGEEGGGPLRGLSESPGWHLWPQGSDVLQRIPHRRAPAHAYSLITACLFAASQAFNWSRVWVQKCTSQHFDGTPAVKRDLYWTLCNLNPTQMEGNGTRHRVGGMSVLDSRRTTTSAFEDYYRWLLSRLI